MGVIEICGGSANFQTQKGLIKASFANAGQQDKSYERSETAKKNTNLQDGAPNPQERLYTVDIVTSFPKVSFGSRQSRTVISLTPKRLIRSH